MTLAPCSDRVLIQRIEDPPGLIELTDQPKSIKGLVLAVGPGRWIPGEWWCFWDLEWASDIEPSDGQQMKAWRARWEWIPGYRQALTIKPGMKVLFNSKWNDFAHAENKGTGSDFSGPLERPLPVTADPMLHLVQEADIFAIVPDFDFKATILPALLEREYMRDIGEHAYEA